MNISNINNMLDGIRDRQRERNVGLRDISGLLLAVLLMLVWSAAHAGHTTPGSALLTGINKVHPSQDLIRLGYAYQDVTEHHAEALQAYENEDFHLAYRLWLPLAKAGHSEAQYYLGMMYDSGTGVAQDLPVAVSWYQRAAEHGNRLAQHNLAVAYANGEGVAPSIREAVKWWQYAARQGNIDAQYNLGIVYATGRSGLNKDFSTAMKWWRMAAESGDPMAQYNLGALYANGQAGALNYCEAVRWWEKSASNGIAQASLAIEVIKTRKDYTICQ